MSPLLRIMLTAAACVLLNQSSWSQNATVFLSEHNFPVADSSVVSAQALQQGFAGAREATAAQLDGALG